MWDQYNVFADDGDYLNHEKVFKRHIKLLNLTNVFGWENYRRNALRDQWDRLRKPRQNDHHFAGESELSSCLQ